MKPLSGLVCPGQPMIDDSIAATGVPPLCPAHNLRGHATANLLRRLAHPKGFEPLASAFGGQRSIQLSYGCLAVEARA